MIYLLIGGTIAGLLILLLYGLAKALDDKEQDVRDAADHFIKKLDIPTKCFGCKYLKKHIRKTNDVPKHIVSYTCNHKFCAKMDFRTGEIVDLDVPDPNKTPWFCPLKYESEEDIWEA